VPSENVREVVRPGLITPLPKLPAYVLGVCGHRGEVLPVLDLLRFLGKGEARIGPRSRFFIAFSDKHVVSVVADSVIGLRRILEADILPVPMSGDAATEHLMGIVQAKGKQEGLMLVHFTKLLAAARQKAVAR
jgi:purine-binding chemotaxis protein CheW